jgi:GTP diphosphokinase / guanosine-3',5'-bis(diphosphate) 3'-diphosphatase
MTCCARCKVTVMGPAPKIATEIIPSPIDCAADFATHEDAFSRLRACAEAYLSDDDLSRLERAYRLAVESHKGQCRQSGEPYVIHPIAVSTILASLRLDVATLITGLLHDTVEDTGVVLNDIEQQFGRDVRHLVDGVTKLGAVSEKAREDVTAQRYQPGAVKGSAQGENLQKFVLAIADDIRVLLVKLADRLHNMQTLGGLSKPEKRQKKAVETLEIYAPLARRIGLNVVSSQLEDLAFRELDPEGYRTIEDQLAQHRNKHGKAVEEVEERLKAILEQDSIKARAFGREKKPYSIWRKLHRRSVDFEDLGDVYGFRVVVEKPEECYAALGIIHRRWRCVPERFKDYISSPKPNSYQSIHTTVMGPGNARVELQIRTEAMNRVAEEGLAAHWRYKNRSYGFDVEAAQNQGGDPLSSIRNLVEVLQHSDNPDEFLEHAKLEMFTDQVYVFTPKGRVVALPSNASALDFAYGVHSELGDTAEGAKINGRRAHLRTVLKNGDVVEVLRSATPSVPPDWEHFVVTGRARAALRRLIRRSHREEFKQLGVSLLERRFLELGANFSEVDLRPAMEVLGFKSRTDLIVAVGENRLRPLHVFDALFPGRKRTDVTEVRDRIEDRTARLYVHGRRLLPGDTMHFSKCCSPLPGDRIVGLRTDANHVAIHAIDCDDLKSFEDDDNWIDLGWSAEAQDNAIAVGRIKATVAHRPGVLAEIATAVTRSSGNITGVQILSRSPELFDMAFDVEVHDTVHLHNLIATMRACPSVMAASRAQATQDPL